MSVVIKKALKNPREVKDIEVQNDCKVKQQNRHYVRINNLTVM